MPAKDEKPEENQFYARDDKNEGTLYYNGTLTEAADSVFLSVYADDKPYNERDAEAGRRQGVRLRREAQAGARSSTRSSSAPRPATARRCCDTVGNLVCGDAYLIDGQSNAEATDFGKDDTRFTSDWIRTFGSMSGSPQGRRQAVGQRGRTAAATAAKLQIGYWGMELARRLVENQQGPDLHHQRRGRRDAHRPAPAQPGRPGRHRRRSTAGCSGACGRRGSRTASAASSGTRARTTRAPTAPPAASAGKPTANTSSTWRRRGSRTTPTSSTTTSSRSGPSPARWASTAPTTACARCSARCRPRSPT